MASHLRKLSASAREASKRAALLCCAALYSDDQAERDRANAELERIRIEVENGQRAQPELLLVRGGA